MISKLIKHIRCFFMGHELEEEPFRAYGNHWVVITKCELCGMKKMKKGDDE
jgi:hypothetical protein